MLTADRIIAGGIMALSLYFMSHAIALPIGWHGETGGPGGGAFPFWLSLVMLIAAAGVLARSFRSVAVASFEFDHEMLRPLLMVIASIGITIALIPLVGAYIALPLFIFWYVKIYGRHGWIVALCLTLGTPVAIFFFFEATLKILLPKGITEPWFFPLYAMFF